MTSVNRIRVALGGTPVTGPGVATHYWLGTATNADIVAFVDFWFALSALMPSAMSITVPNEGDIIDDNTGAPTGIWTGTGGSTFAGGDTGSFAKGVGARIVWQTAGMTGSRRVRGSTFVVPLAGSKFQTDGTLTTAAVDAIVGAAGDLRAALPDRLVVLTRLTTAHSGTSHAVTDHSVPDTPSWLRSRRT